MATGKDGGMTKEIDVASDDRKTRAVRYDKDAYRLERGTDIVGTALRLTNDRWALFDREERRLTRSTYPNPAAVAAAFDSMDVEKAS